MWGHILCLNCFGKANVGMRKHGRKNFSKKRKKVLTKGERGGNISERLNEGRLSGGRQELTQGLEPQGKAQVSRRKSDTRNQRNLKKGVDKGFWMWYYETPAAVGGVHLVN